jgi:hypothetical protein
VEGSGRGLIEELSWHLSGGTEGTKRKTLIRIGDVQVKIRTQQLLITIPERYSYTDLLGKVYSKKPRGKTDIFCDLLRHRENRLLFTKLSKYRSCFNMQVQIILEQCRA